MSSKHLKSGVELYYGAGFCSQVVSLRLGDDKKTTSSVCELLEVSKRSKDIQACLSQRKLSEQLLTVYRAESEKVVEIKGEVRMVPSTSSSSVGDKSVEIFKKDVAKFSESMRALHELVEIDEESEYAEEGSDNLSSRESNRQSDEDARGESDEESSSYKPPL